MGVFLSQSGLMTVKSVLCLLRNDGWQVDKSPPGRCLPARVKVLAEATTAP